MGKTKLALKLRTTGPAPYMLVKYILNLLLLLLILKLWRRVQSRNILTKPSRMNMVIIQLGCRCEKFKIRKKRTKLQQKNVEIMEKYQRKSVNKRYFFFLQ